MKISLMFAIGFQVGALVMAAFVGFTTRRHSEAADKVSRSKFRKEALSALGLSLLFQGIALKLSGVI